MHFKGYTAKQAAPAGKKETLHANNPRCWCTWRARRGGAPREPLMAAERQAPHPLAVEFYLMRSRLNVQVTYG